MDNIELWAGHKGIKLDSYGNITSIDDGYRPPIKEQPFNLDEMYQSILKELGFTIDIDKQRGFDNCSDIITYHIYNDGNPYYYDKKFGWTIRRKNKKEE